MKDIALTKNHTKHICECCKKLKMCKLYTLQSGITAWVCDDCRRGS